MARLRILGVRVERQAGRVAVVVSLGRGGEMATGRIDRVAVEAEMPRVGAEAALEALRQIAPAGTRWILRETAVSPTARGSAVVVQVILETEDREEYLTGSALSSTPPLEEAAARAVVDAVDRRLGWLM